MATFLADSDICEAKFACYSTAQTQVSLNIRHYRITAVTGNVTDLELATQLDNGLSALYAACMPAAASYYGVQVRIITTLPGNVPVIAHNNELTGSFGGSLTAGQVSGIGTLRSFLVGRTNRGRVYVGFVPSTAIATDGQPTNTYLTALGQVINAFGVDVPITGALGNCLAVPVIFHRVARTSTDIVTVLTRNKLATQRRRGAYGRPNSFPPFVP